MRQPETPGQIAARVAVADLNKRGYPCFVEKPTAPDPGIRPAHSFPPPAVLIGAMAKGWVAAGDPDHLLACPHHASMEGGQFLCRRVPARALLSGELATCGGLN